MQRLSRRASVAIRPELHGPPPGIREGWYSAWGTAGTRSAGRHVRDWRPGMGRGQDARRVFYPPLSLFLFFSFFYSLLISFSLGPTAGRPSPRTRHKLSVVRCGGQGIRRADGRGGGRVAASGWESNRAWERSSGHVFACACEQVVACASGSRASAAAGVRTGLGRADRGAQEAEPGESDRVQAWRQAGEPDQDKQRRTRRREWERASVWLSGGMPAMLAGGSATAEYLARNSSGEK